MKVELLAVLILLVGLGILGVWIYIVRQGDAEIEILTAQRTELQLVSVEDGKGVFSAQIPLFNLASQDGIILDAFPRHLLPQEQYDAARVESRLELLTAPREDGYFEAVIIEGNKGNTLVLTVALTAKNGSLAEAVASMADMPVELYYQVVGRGECALHKERLVLPAAEFKTAFSAQAVVPDAVESETQPAMAEEEA
ncbi:hypothetical protein [Anaeromusa acidaminophila]|uniref:hypothetical protein n=1 Tax=Sporomusaceae TaxID=1843490 RepID=UPI0003679A8B